MVLICSGPSQRIGPKRNDFLDSRRSKMALEPKPGGPSGLEGALVRIGTELCADTGPKFNIWSVDPFRWGQDTPGYSKKQKQKWL